MFWSKVVLFSIYCNLAMARKLRLGILKPSRNNPSNFVMPECTNIDALCVQSAAENAKIFLARGIPNFGISPMEPLVLSNLRLKQPITNDEFSFDAWLSDVHVHGLTLYTFNHLEIDPEHMKASANISLPALRISGDFMIIGRFQRLPIELIGQLIVNFTQCTAYVETEGARFHSSIVVQKVFVLLDCIDPVETDLNNAKSPSEDMEKITDHIVLMHSDDILKEIQSGVETALASLIEDVTNKIIKHLF